MFWQLSHDLVDYIIVRFITRLHDDIGLCIERFPHRQQIPDLFRKRTVGSALCALQQHLNVRFQPDRNAFFSDQRPSVRV
jgi:hypothetical protein